jgi:hypothetical protein
MRELHYVTSSLQARILRAAHRVNLICIKVRPRHAFAMQSDLYTESNEHVAAADSSLQQTQVGIIGTRR